MSDARSNTGGCLPVHLSSEFVVRRQLLVQQECFGIIITYQFPKIAGTRRGCIILKMGFQTLTHVITCRQNVWPSIKHRHLRPDCIVMISIYCQLSICAESSTSIDTILETFWRLLYVDRPRRIEGTKIATPITRGTNVNQLHSGESAALS
jgi:hypothetical protein